MKHLLTGLLLLFATAATAPAGQKVSECFKVHSLIKMDNDHYWANWTNGCPYTIDSVYVMVKFVDRARTTLGKGVWSLHFIAPGASRVIRFTTPLSLPPYDSVNVLKITTDSEEALH
jgi:hypothetical protein